MRKSRKERTQTTPKGVEIPVPKRSDVLRDLRKVAAPFLRPPWPGADELPKVIAAGDEATFYLDPVANIAEVHAELRAKWVYARLGGKVEFHGDRIDKKWLDGWVKR